MNNTGCVRAHILPSNLSGTLPAVASKSMAHRLLILATLANQPCEFVCNTSSQDIEATARCLRELQRFMFGKAEPGSAPRPVAHEVTAKPACTLDCGESGSTLRFLLPIVCALGIPARFVRHGRLAERPLFPLDRELAEHGATLIEQDGDLLVAGTLRSGRFTLPGDVSSQYISGLLMAATVMEGSSEVWVSAPVQSRPYIELTIHALSAFGQQVTCSNITCDGMPYERFCLEPCGLTAPPTCIVEGDWSNAAFWLCAGSMEREGITVSGLDLTSPQGDRAILAALAGFGARIARKGDAARATADAPRAATLSVQAIPDLVPPLAAIAATAPGTSRLSNAGRLRLKESDRLSSITDAINALGGRARIDGDDLVIEGVSYLTGGTVNAQNDHRVAMMGAIMATHAKGPVTILDAACVAKSYPNFWDDYATLGGKVTLTSEIEE